MASMSRAPVVVTAQESGRAGLRSLFGRVVRLRVAPVWYGVVLLGPILLMLAALALEVVALSGQPPSLGALIGAQPVLVIVALYMVFFVALGEEVGWRGYALPAFAGALRRPRLQRDPRGAVGPVAPAGLLQPGDALQRPALRPAS